MKYCDSLDIEMTPNGAVMKGWFWPGEIRVERGLLDYLPGPHVMFGRMGTLRFQCSNGYAIYRRAEDLPGGWRYGLTEEHKLQGAQPAAKPAEKPAEAVKSFERHNGIGTAEAFRWAPFDVPPVELPEWFIRTDFQHVAADGKLIIRSPSGTPLLAMPGDWIVREHGRIFPMQPRPFAEQYSERKS